MDYARDCQDALQLVVDECRAHRDFPPRAVPREINKFARLTHAISISAADVNSRTTSAICVFPAISSRNGFMTTEWGPLKSFSVTCRLNAAIDSCMRYGNARDLAQRWREAVCGVA